MNRRSVGVFSYAADLLIDSGAKVADYRMSAARLIECGYWTEAGALTDEGVLVRAEIQKLRRMDFAAYQAEVRS